MMFILGFIIGLIVGAIVILMMRLPDQVIQSGDGSFNYQIRDNEEGDSK